MILALFILALLIAMFIMSRKGMLSRQPGSFRIVSGIVGWLIVSYLVFDLPGSLRREYTLVAGQPLQVKVLAIEPINGLGVARSAILCALEVEGQEAQAVFIYGSTKPPIKPGQQLDAHALITEKRQWAFLDDDGSYSRMNLVISIMSLVFGIGLIISDERRKAALAAAALAKT